MSIVRKAAASRKSPITADLFDEPFGPVSLHSPCGCTARTGYQLAGRGPHAAELRCSRGHHVGWLPRRRGGDLARRLHDIAGDVRALIRICRADVGDELQAIEKSLERAAARADTEH